MNRNARIVFMAVLVMCTVIAVIGALMVTAEAGKETVRPGRTYESVCIGSGDTLWGYAETYAGATGMSVREYVSEVKKINGLKSDWLISGTYLILVKPQD
ncbi:MAG: hypothetical protein J6U26_05960 [Lachnospiraceae bacterium]|nr:hypothetical protein [Lachnospiraceae bacterium]